MIGLFGGSFDPIHHGHLLVAQAALEALGLERVLFIPARVQPLKRDRQGAPPAVRAEMVRRAIAGEPRFVLDPLELEREGPSYTVDTLRTLHARAPGERFVLLLGADAARDFGAWKSGDEILRLAQLCILTRNGEVPPVLPDGARILPVPALQISATAIRDRVRRGQPIRWWVPDAVAAYIAAERLYLRDD